MQAAKALIFIFTHRKQKKYKETFLKIRPKCPLLFFLKNGMIVNGTFVLIESPAGVFSPVPLWRRSIMARHQQFGGFGGGANMQQLMRQAQKLQEQMTKAQEDIEAREFSAQAGGGMVSEIGRAHV